MDTDTAQLHSDSSNDIFSLSDQILSDRLEFIEEIGFGNWGSVWLCRPKPATTPEGVVKPLGQKLAVKLVHRSKTSTTAARVRSLWNEMKIVRSFKSDPHPSIIPFHSFIITPSYALITMTYLPTLVPVEVEESKAREWFRFLLSGVEFLHKRGVVHNDIKPANILLSHKNIPVLVDFGFAEKYDTASDTAFHSNLSYGTPEYLSPERARGLPHDTRKSDVWSLGVTFFEILMGRTPFENSDGEQFNSNEDLEKYWSRTLRGKWVGKWEFSKGMEKLLQRMIAPNADLRCTAMQAIADSYWKDSLATNSSHKRASSHNSSIVFEKDFDKLLNFTPSSRRNKENKNNHHSIHIQSPPGLDATMDIFRDDTTNTINKHPPLAKSKSQPKVAAGSGSKIAQPRKRAQAMPMPELSPIQASPTTSPYTGSAAAKENIQSFNRLAASVNSKSHAKKAGKERVDVDENAIGNTTPNSARRPFGALNARENLPQPLQQQQQQQQQQQRPAATMIPSRKPSGQSYGAKAVKVLGDLETNINNSSNNTKNINITSKKKQPEYGGDEHSYSFTQERSKDSTNVKDRMREWEREKERLREMERLEEMERDRDEIYKREKKARKERETEEEKENRVVEEEVKERKNASHLQIRIPQASNTNKGQDWDKENVDGAPGTSPVLPMFKVGPPLTQVLNVMADTPPPPSTFQTRVTKEANRNIFKHSIKASIDKTFRFYKSSVASASGRSTPARGFSFDVMWSNAEPQTQTQTQTTSSQTMTTKDGREAWETDMEGSSLPEISPLPVIKNAAESERVAADSRMDRMTIWMRNVEKVVEDAKQNFAAASSTTKDLPLPALPLPLSRTASQSRTSRLPRRVLAASQIFQEDENGNLSPMGDQTMNSMYLDTSKASISPVADPSSPAAPASSVRGSRTSVEPVASPPPLAKKTTNDVQEEHEGRGQMQMQIPEIHTPSRQRRATVSTRSPEPAESQVRPVFDDAPLLSQVDGGSPSKRKEKSRSHGNLFQRHIAPILVLEAELSKTPPPPPTPRLSEVLDRNLFIAPLLTSRDNLLDSSIEHVREPSMDDLNASPCHVEPYPPRPRASQDAPIPDTPSRHRIEGVYDRFLMATSGVKRLGKGYQSDNLAPVGGGCGIGNTSTNTSLGSSAFGGQHQHQQQQSLKTRAFYSTKRPMPPPVSSDDLVRDDDEQRRAVSVDELGWRAYSGVGVGSPGANGREEGNTVAFKMRKAMKLMVPKSTAMSRRLSRMG